MTALATPQQYVTFTAHDPPGPSVVALLGDGVIQLTNKGGWQYTGRSHRISMTEYSGDDPYQMVIPCVLDRWASGGTVDAAYESLVGIMTNIVGPRNEPAIVRVFGAGLPLTNLDWVIQTIANHSEVRLSTGARTRVEFDVTLYQYLAPDIIISAVHTSPAAAAQTRNNARTTSSMATRTYTVRRGDTLSAIAARLLGSSARWHDIATLNKIRDPRLLQVGVVLRIPS